VVGERGAVGARVGRDGGGARIAAEASPRARALPPVAAPKRSVQATSPRATAAAPAPIAASDLLDSLRAARADEATHAAPGAPAAGHAPANDGDATVSTKTLRHHDFVLETWLGPEFERRQQQLAALKHQFAQLEAEYDLATPGLGRMPVWEWGEYLEYSKA